MKKLYLSASTQEKNLGVDGISEEKRMQALAKDVAVKLKGRFEVRLNRPEMTLMQIIDDSNQWKPDFHLALHTNAMAGKWAGKASGLECWIHNNSVRGNRMADILIHRLSVVTGLAIRGGKEDPDTKETEVDGGRLAEVDRVAAPACIAEIGFHDLQKDNRILIERWQAIVAAIVDSIEEYFENEEEKTAG